MFILPNETFLPEFPPIAFEHIYLFLRPSTVHKSIKSQEMALTAYTEKGRILAICEERSFT